MAIILDSDQPFTKGRSYPVSRIRGRKTITASVGAEQSEVWEQHQEPGGVINPHYHDVEETIVVLAGRASVTIGDDAPRELSAPFSLFIPSGIVHRIENVGDTDTHSIAFFPKINPQTIYVEP